MLNKGNEVDVIYLDFNKAFDVTLFKREKIGISA